MPAAAQPQDPIVVLFHAASRMAAMGCKIPPRSFHGYGTCRKIHCAKGLNQRDAFRGNRCSFYEYPIGGIDRAERSSHPDSPRTMVNRVHLPRRPPQQGTCLLNAAEYQDFHAACWVSTGSVSAYRAWRRFSSISIQHATVRTLPIRWALPSPNRYRGTPAFFIRRSSATLVTVT